MSTKSTRTALIAATTAFVSFDTLEGRRLMAGPTMTGPDLVSIISFPGSDGNSTSYHLQASHNDDRLAFHVGAVENDAGPAVSVTVNRIGSKIKQVIDWPANDRPAYLGIDSLDGNDQIEVRTSALNLLGEDQYGPFEYRIYVNGGNGNDRIQVFNQTGMIDAGDGNDTVYGGPGRDNIYAGAGNDWVSAGAGDDWVMPGSGKNWIDCGLGNDSVYTSFSSWNNGQYNQFDALRDTIIGGGGNDLFKVFYTSSDASHLPTILTQLSKTKFFGVEIIGTEESDKG